MDRTWMKEPITMSYEDLFNHVVESKILKDTFNSDKLAEVGFEIPLMVYEKKHNKSPYTEDSYVGKLTYVDGDATEPIGSGYKCIVHICNDIGGWGRGFVLSLSNKWKEPEESYRLWHRNTYYDVDLDIGNGTYDTKCDFELGNIQLVPVEEDISVINMIAQSGCYPTKDIKGNLIQPIRYEALQKCLFKVSILAARNSYSVHMPLIGAGLAGGDWNIIEAIIQNTLIKNGIDTTVYILNEK